MNRGFTITEILITIALIAMLVLLIVPNVINYFNRSIKNTMKIQENEIVDATKIYIDDYCKNPISNDYVCALNYTIDDQGFLIFSGLLDINVLINEEYIDEIYASGTKCEGYVEVDDTELKAFLNCGDKYTTEGYVYE